MQSIETRLQAVFLSTHRGSPCVLLSGLLSPKDFLIDGCRIDPETSLDADKTPDLVDVAPAAIADPDPPTQGTLPEKVPRRARRLLVLP